MFGKTNKDEPPAEVEAVEEEAPASFTVAKIVGVLVKHEDGSEATYTSFPVDVAFYEGTTVEPLFA